MRRGYRDDPETGTLAGERVFHSGGLELRYLLEHSTERADVLVAAFSAAHERHQPPRYYTIRALQGIPCARLFVLDDHGPSGPPARPSWYLGANRRLDVPAAVLELMTEITRELEIAPNHVITCGASKGGWASLYFGARFGAGHVVAGEPQAFLGRHLLQDGTYDIATYVAGGSSREDVEYLDALVFDAFRGAQNPPWVHLYCGSGSYYYTNHVLPLSRFLDGIRVACELEVGEHSNHVPDLGAHFPAYLVRRLTSLIDAMDRGGAAGRHGGGARIG
jgi:hypothetical protein